MKRTPLRCCLPLLALALAACGDDPTGPAVDQIVLEVGSAAIIVGDTTRLKATVTGADGKQASGGIRWTSLDPAVAKVDRSGLVTGVARGTVRITGEVGGVLDTARIHVVPGQFNVQAEDACESPDYRTGRVAAVGEHSIVIADVANPTGGFTDDDYREVARTFDKSIHPVITQNFGEPADIDDNGRVLIFYTRAVNEMTPPGSQGYVGGFFFARDLFPKSNSATMQGCKGSNESEMFYLLAPDPNGVVNGNRRDTETVLQVTLGTIAHEYQHLINASRRLLVNNAQGWEEVWLNEGLSHIAEELMFYHVAGLAPRQNIDVDRIRDVPMGTGVDAFNAYQGSNFGRLSAFLDKPEQHSGYSEEARLGDRGAIWHFLRYIADRSSLPDRDIWYRLANSNTSGFNNLRAVLGQDPLPLYRHWAIAAYTDDLVTTADANFQQPSWNYQTIMPAISSKLVSPRLLRPSEPQRFTLQGGGSAYLQFRVAMTQRAEIQVAAGSSGSATPGSCVAESPPLVLKVGEVYTPGAGEGTTLCLDGGVSGGTYVVVTTSLANATTQSAIAVTGFGIASPGPLGTLLASGPAFQLQQATQQLEQPRLARGRALGPALAGGAEQPVLDHSVHERIRRQEIALLAPLGGRTDLKRSNALRSGTLRSGALLQENPAAGADPNLYIALIRVK